MNSGDYRVIESEAGSFLFVSDGSRLYEFDPAGAVPNDAAIRRIVAQDLSSRPKRIDPRPLDPPPLQTLSLNVAQACNMSCGYCYAGEGKFGGAARLMPVAVARTAVDRLIAESSTGADLVVGFMGGEPFLNRPVLYDIVPYAVHAARAAGRRVRFSVTTNATVLDSEDARLLTEHPFQVAMSIDGDRGANDSTRRLRGHASAYDRVVAALSLFDARRPRHLSARMTVTAGLTGLVHQLEHVLSLGFDSAGFSPVLVSPDPRLALGTDDLGRFLREMIECGECAKQAIVAGRRFPFSNFEAALQQIHRGAHRPYACGAGAAYLSVNAEGKLYACHRFVDDEARMMGDIWSGSDFEARERHLAHTHVDRQAPCSGCWARYLCGGGCQHEVQSRGRPACDYIRGWLEFCLSSYCEVLAAAPGYFNAPEQHFEKALAAEEGVSP
jgi:uncharacterized protein